MAEVSAVWREYADAIPLDKMRCCKDVQVTDPLFD